MKVSKITFVVFNLVITVISNVYTQITEHKKIEYCPPEWNSSVCFCEAARLIKCDGVSDVEQIEDALRHSWNQTRFAEFNIVYSNVTKLTDHVVNKLSFEKILISDTNLGSISKLAFKDSEDTALTVVIVRSNLSSEFDLQFLLPLRRLQMVAFFYSNFVAMPTGVFNNLLDLQRIFLSSSNLVMFEKYAVSLLPKLTILDLSSNKITKLEKNMLNTSQAQQPVTLNLQHNEISEVETGAFADLKSNRVDLEHNKLVTLNQDAFETILDFMSSIENSELLVGGNPIVCDSRLSWLYQKPPEYRLQVKGLLCEEITTIPEAGTTQTPPKREGDCLYQISSDKVQAFFHGKLLVNQSSIPHLGVITLRCTNVQNLKFVGNNKIKCLRGNFTDITPHCMILIPNSYDTAPPLWFITYPNILPPVTEEGIVIVPRGSSISIVCRWSVKKPDMTVTGNARYKSQKLQSIAKTKVWRTVFNPIYKISQINFTCSVPVSQAEGNLTQKLQIKITDSCRVEEKQIEARGLSIIPRSRKFVYVEEDRVDLMCTKSMSRGVRYMTCKRKGEWEWGLEEDCADENTIFEKEIRK